jgi:hypothetical protein
MCDFNMKARRFEQETSGRHGTFHLSLKPSTSVIAPTSIDFHLRPRRRRKVVDFIQTHFMVGAFASPHGSVRQVISRDESSRNGDLERIVSVLR